MALIRARPPKEGYSHIAGPEDSELSLVRFGLLRLSPGASFGLKWDGLEAVLVILGGRCDVEAGEDRWQGIGSRRDVFGGKPTAVYVAPGDAVTVIARADAEIAACAAPAQRGAQTRLIAPEQVGVRRVGQGTFQREIYDIAVAGSVDAERLLVGETYNPPGLWSSYPPHKHDIDAPPGESKLEELYHFRVNPPQGFGMQRIYGDGFDESYTVQDGDTVTIPRGFHPVAAAPGYQLYYLWILAGEQRVMRPRDDGAHSWVASQT